MVAEPIVQVVNTKSEDMVICKNESINLWALGANSYTWSPTTGLNQSTGSSVTASPTETTNYTITGTMDNGLTDTYEITIEVGADINPVIQGLPVSVNINQGSISLSANPAGGTFSGNGVAFNTFNPILNSSGLEEITYTYTDENTGCISQTSQSVLVFSISFNFVNYNLNTIDPKLGELIIETFTEDLGTYDLLLTNVNGRLVHNNKIEINQAKQLHVLNEIKVPFGIYSATLKKGNQIFSKQLVLGR